MSVRLLDKTRRINKLLQSTGMSRIKFTDICEVLGDILGSNVLILSKKGKLLAINDQRAQNRIDELLPKKIGELVDEQLKERILNILSTKENIQLEILGFTEACAHMTAMIIPVDIAGERLGTLFLYKEGSKYHLEDIILGEYGATVVGLEVMRSINEETSEEARKIAVVKSAISTLSFSEQEAVKHIFQELDGLEGILVASRVADRVGITRSVIVNALRKFESAGVIESRSLGMKGTYIKVLNDILMVELERM